MGAGTLIIRELGALEIFLFSGVPAASACITLVS